MNAQLTPACKNPRTRRVLDAATPPNRQFKANPRLLARAQGMYYWTHDGREVLDGVAGLWCVNAGHGRREITEAVTQATRDHEVRAHFPNGTPIHRLRTRKPSGARSRLQAWIAFSSPIPAPSPWTRHSRSPLHTIAPRAPANEPGSSAARRATTAWASAACRRGHGQQSQILRLIDAARRRPPAAHPGSRTQRFLARIAAMGRASGERTGATDRAA